MQRKPFLRILVAILLCAMIQGTVIFASADVDLSVFPGEASLRNIFSEHNPLMGVSGIDGQSVTVSIVIPVAFEAVCELWFQESVDADAHLLGSYDAGQTRSLTFENLPAGQYVYLSAAVGRYLTRDTVPPFNTNFGGASILAFGVDGEGNPLPSYLVTGFTTKAVSVIALDPSTGEQVPLTSGQVLLTNGNPVRTAKAKDERLNPGGLQASTPYRLIASADKGQPDMFFVFRTAKKPLRVNKKKLQEAWDAFDKEAEGIINDIMNMSDPSQVAGILARIDSFNARFDETFPTGQIESDNSSETMAKPFSKDDIANLMGEETGPKLTFEEKMEKMGERIDAIKPVIDELQRYVDKRVGSTQALADALGDAKTQELIDAIGSFDLEDIQISSAAAGDQTDAIGALRQLLEALHREVRSINTATLTLCREDGVSFADKRSFATQLGKLDQALQELKKALGKSRDNLSAQVTEDDTPIASLVDAYLEGYQQGDLGLSRSIPNGSAEFSKQ